MSRLWFKSPVDIWIRDGVLLTVNNVAQAGRVLLEEWPEKFAKTPKHELARKACLAAMEGKVPAEKAAVAFAAAAREAGLLDD
jgi:hypothetical protein